MLVSNGTGIAVSAGAGNKGVPLIVGMGTTDGSIGNGFGAKVSGKVVGTPAVEIAIPPVTGVGFTFCGFGFTTPGTIGVGVKLVVLGTTSFGATGTFGVIPPAPGITPIVGLGAICTGVRGTGSGLTASFGSTGTFGVTTPAGGITPIVGLGAICTGVRGTGSGLTASFGATGTFGVTPPAGGITPIVGLGAICTGVRGTGSGIKF